jgi:butyrate kinase
MCYQIAKEIGGLYFIANGRIDQLIITGGLAYSKFIMKCLENYLQGIISYTVYPGEDEMQALVDGALRVLNKEEQAKQY